MLRTFKKEIVVFTDPQIEELYFGALPAVGHYFTKKCEKITDGAFRIEVDVPKGDLYYHLYYNSSQRNHSPTAMLSTANASIGASQWHTACQIGTKLMLPVTFAAPIEALAVLSMAVGE